MGLYEYAHGQDHWPFGCKDPARWCISNLNYGHIQLDMGGLIITDPGPLFHLSSGNSSNPDPCLVRWEAIQPANEGIYPERRRGTRCGSDLDGGGALMMARTAHQHFHFNDDAKSDIQCYGFHFGDAIMMMRRRFLVLLDWCCRRG